MGARALRRFEVGQRLPRMPQADVDLARGGLVRRSPQPGRGLLSQPLTFLVGVVEVALMLHALFLAPASHGPAV